MRGYSDEHETFDDLESRLTAMLPAMYQNNQDEVRAVSMGSAGLKYGADGKAAWNEIWGSFCDLAMAGGPPHKGMLLDPGDKQEIDAGAERYDNVVEEICRGIAMVTGLYADPSPLPGWIRMHCTSAVMARWLAHAIVMENVSAGFKGLGIYLPAGPRYRVEKEIKNVVTAVAKTTHYWVEHTPREQHWVIAKLFLKMDSESPVVQALLFEDDIQDSRQWMLVSKMTACIFERTGLRSANLPHAAWLGLDCSDLRAAIWMMRVLVVSNVFARHEGTVLLVPVNPVSDPDGEVVVRMVVRAYGFCVSRKIF